MYRHKLRQEQEAIEKLPRNSRGRLARDAPLGQKQAVTEATEEEQRQLSEMQAIEEVIMLCRKMRLCWSSEWLAGMIDMAEQST